MTGMLFNAKSFLFISTSGRNLQGLFIAHAVQDPSSRRGMTRIIIVSAKRRVIRNPEQTDSGNADSISHLAQSQLPGKSDLDRQTIDHMLIHTPGKFQLHQDFPAAGFKGGQ